jgi:hypothetical protein
MLTLERALPPDVVLPTATDSTEQYRLEQYLNRRPYADIIDYGTFVVALACIGAVETERVSMMPLISDVKELKEAGFGMPYEMLARRYGGIRKLQLALGFYPEGYNPPKEKLLKRLQWMAEHAYVEDASSDIAKDTVYEVFNWGSARNLTPSAKRSYKILDGETLPVIKMFHTEQRAAIPEYTSRYLYRFGSRVLQEHGRALSRSELAAAYGQEFDGNPGKVITAKFGSYAQFWLEFDRLPQVVLTPQELRNLGVRWAIAHDTPEIGINDIKERSDRQLLPSRMPIRNTYGNITHYREVVREDYALYLQVRDSLVAEHVSEEVVKLACRKFEATPEFVNGLLAQSATLATLSAATPGMSYVRKLLHEGLRLEEDAIYAMQLEDVANILLGHRIGPHERAFIFELMPRLNVNEIDLN